MTRPVVVYGAGAIGGVVAARLGLSGADVTAVARGEHLRAIRRDGLTLVTHDGVQTVEVSTAADAGEVDWRGRPAVLLTVKGHQSAAALADLSRHAPVDTAVFVAQNGVANEPAALRNFANVYGVAVLVSAAHLEPGVVVQQRQPIPGILDLGRFPRGADDTAEEFAAQLRGAQFAAQVREDIMAWKYRKLIVNLANGVTAVFRPGPDADELVARARTEAEEVLAVAGIDVVTAAQDAQRRSVLSAGRLRTDYFGSTWQSMARGHDAVETDWFNGEIVLLARLAGIPAPANELIARVTAEHARSGRPPRSLDAAHALAGLGSSPRSGSRA